jgi:tetratricopeptide (TPR) repeat protein
LLHSLTAALAGLGLVVLTAALAAESTAPQAAATEPVPEQAQEQSAVAESVQPQVEEAAIDEALEKRERIIAEATNAIAESRHALRALDEGDTDEAVQALETAVGKLELILARNPDLALAPVDVTLTTYDLIADPEVVEELIARARKHLEKGAVQKARPLIASLASEMVIETTSIPLATYPEAIKAVAPLIDEGEIAAAKSALQTALNTLVVTTDEVIPLPALRAEHLLAEAETLAENRERSEEQEARLRELLEEARTQLELGRVLGYGDKQDYRPILEQLDEIEAKTAGGKGGAGWFDKIRRQISELL